MHSPNCRYILNNAALDFFLLLPYLLVWLITGNVTLNQSASLFVTALGRLGGGYSALLNRETASPVILNKRCFTLIGAHLCGVLMDVLG